MPTKKKAIYKPKPTINCDVCGGRYTVSNKSIHDNSKKHTKILDIKNALSEYIKKKCVGEM